MVPEILCMFPKEEGNQQFYPDMVPVTHINDQRGTITPQVQSQQGYLGSNQMLPNGFKAQQEGYYA